MADKKMPAPPRIQKKENGKTDADNSLKGKTVKQNMNSTVGQVKNGSSK